MLVVPNPFRHVRSFGTYYADSGMEEHPRGFDVNETPRFKGGHCHVGVWCRNGLWIDRDVFEYLPPAEYAPLEWTCVVDRNGDLFGERLGDIAAVAQRMALVRRGHDVSDGNESETQCESHARDRGSYKYL